VQLKVIIILTLDKKLAVDELYLLSIDQDCEKGQWMVVQTDGLTPGKRYGHTMSFKESYIFLFGGSNNSEIKNDLWVLSIDKVPFKWKKIEFTGLVPDRRVYHSSCASDSKDDSSMILIFGGRSKDQTSRNDLWTLYKRIDDTWEWVMEDYVKDTAPAPRYQVIQLLNTYSTLLSSYTECLLLLVAESIV
jgi:hypothetical protein